MNVREAHKKVKEFAKRKDCPHIHRWTPRETRDWDKSMDETVKELVNFGTSNTVKIEGKVKGFWEVFKELEPGEKNMPIGGMMDYVVVQDANRLMFFKYHFGVLSDEWWELLQVIIG